MNGAVKSPAVKSNTTSAALVFRWSYIMLPLGIFLLSMILTAYFYSRLPAEVAYHFKSDGSPDRWLSRGALLLWMLLPQLFLTLLSAAIVWGITRLATRFRQIDSTRIKPERILLLMGNMVALPQIILGFAMLDIFSYNSYQIRLIPLWLFALIIMGVGGIIIGIFLGRVLLRTLGTTKR
ncbi:MAG: DUF1648 domain-containing protein [Chloroflexi bacterium]|nr:DUF1648 domain-containing protein [Chloroflexota bacterium]